MEKPHQADSKEIKSENRMEEQKAIKELLGNKASSSTFNNDKIRRSRDFEFYGITQSRTGTPEVARALKLILSSGEQHIIKYHDIGCPITFDGISKIEFTINATSKITIHGNNLEPILDYLAEERLMWIKESQNNEDLFLGNLGGSDDTTPCLYSINVNLTH